MSSYGIVCHRIRIDFDQRSVFPEFLAIQRKDTIPYVEFVRGKYSPDDLEYVVRLISEMTSDEQENLKSLTFEQMWTSFWGNWRRGSACETDYLAAESVYKRLLSACPISTLVASAVRFAPEREWSFPKGRKMTSETDVSCALREFEEETGFKSSSIHMLNTQPYEEVFEGGNGILYRHVYFLCRLVDMRDAPPRAPPPNSVRARETRDMQWLTCAQLYEKFANAPTRQLVVSRANNDVICILSPDSRGCTTIE